MWLFSFYRIYLSIAAGAVAFYFYRAWWIWITAAIAARIIWFVIESGVSRWVINRNFHRHIAAFKQQLGPYGIRIANKAEADTRIRKSLAEVFVSDLGKLKKAVEQLDVMDTLFKSGMRPDADEYLLHDLKLKYGRLRLEKEQ